MEELCQILRRNKVKLTPNVRSKLKEIDHLLDEEYVTVRINMKKTVTVEVEVGRTNLKRGQEKKKTERKLIEVERDLTILKDPIRFISQLVQDRGLYEPDAMKRVSLDGGDNSIKMIVNVFDRHQDAEISFPQREKKGNLCSGVNRSILMAYCEDLEENYENCRTILDMLRFDELDSVVAADFKLLNVLLGLSGHGGKHALIYCEAPKGLELGSIRTFAGLIKLAEAYKDVGSNTAKMKDFKNVVNVPLLKVENDQPVWQVVPLPELHCMMGGVNHKLELMRKFLVGRGLEDELWEWCDSHGITRRGYNGKNKLDGNNASRFLAKVEDLKTAVWFHNEAEPIVDCLLEFRKVKDKCFGWDLGEDWREDIHSYTSMFSDLQQYAKEVLGETLTVTWKIHMITCHLETFLDKVI